MARFGQNDKGCALASCPDLLSDVCRLLNLIDPGYYLSVRISIYCLLFPLCWCKYLDRNTPAHDRHSHPPASTTVHNLSCMQIKVLLPRQRRTTAESLVPLFRSKRRLPRCLSIVHYSESEAGLSTNRQGN